jgi:PAS domain S-box-containing protein
MNPSISKNRSDDPKFATDTSHAFQRQFYFAVLLLVVITLGILVGYVWMSYKEFDLTAKRDFQLQELGSVITHLDEVLTMSARMAAATGDLNWERRYRKHEPTLDSAIHTAMKLATEAFLSDAAFQTNTANIKLVALENRAFDLVRHGKRDAAAELLSSEEYEHQKQLYAEGIRQIINTMHERSSIVVQSQRRKALVVVVTIAIIVPVLLIAWLVVWRILGKYVSERKRAVEALDESDQRFKTFAEASFEGITLVENGVIIDLNDQHARMHGYERSELIGKQVVEIVAPESRDYVAERMRHQSKDEHFETFDMRRDGTTFPVEVHGKSMQVGERVLQIAAIRDITERKRADEALKHEKALLDALMDNIPDSIYFKDRQCRLLRISRKMMQDLKLDDMSQAIGKTDVELFGEEFGRKKLEGDEHLMAMGKPIVGLTESRQLENGQINWTSTTKVPLRDESGEIVGLVGITREINELMKAQEERERERNLLRTLIDSLPDLIFFKDAEGRYMLNNRPHLRSLGMARQEDVLGKSTFDFNPRELAEQYHADEMGIVRTGTALLDREERALHKDTGEHRWHLTSKIPLIDSRGKVTGIVGISRDITERKSAEEALRHERTLLRTVIDNLPDGIYAKDTSCRKTLANLADLHNMGRQSEAEVLGKDDFDFFAKDVAEKFFADDQSVLQTGKPVVNKEEYLIDSEGQKRWLLTSKIPLEDAEGRIVGLVGIGRDITKRRIAEEALRESAEKFRFVFENAYDGMSIFEETPDRQQRRLVECNTRYAEMSGRSREELLRIGIASNLASTLTVDDRQSVEHGAVFSGSFSWNRPDGKDNIIEYTAVPIKMQGKTFTIGIDRDVTERRKTEAEREKLIAELQSALSDVRTLSGLVPICANCKKIRDDKGYWTQLERYIQERSAARFSHGICPDCMKKLYPDLTSKE